MSRYLVTYSYVDFDYSYGEEFYSLKTEGKEVVNQNSKAKAIELIIAKGDWVTNIKAHFLRPGKPKKKMKKVLPEYLDLPF